ncbi:hypothetical protein LX36DRAFT_662816 [Colletotrichum falcatum]|nr:hypothetical protein LX36DRAFT_662816 [Colletotrichum falcatum]
MITGHGHHRRPVSHLCPRRARRIVGVGGRLLAGGAQAFAKCLDQHASCDVTVGQTKPLASVALSMRAMKVFAGVFDRGPRPGIGAVR